MTGKSWLLSVLTDLGLGSGEQIGLVKVSAEGAGEAGMLSDLSSEKQSG